MKKWSNNANFCKEWNAEQASQGKTIYKSEDYQKALYMVNQIGEHDTASKWLEGAEFQVAIVWQDEETGIMCKARIDALKPDMLIDVKSTVNASPGEFNRTVNNFMYHVQDEMYTEGWKALKGEKLPFGFVVVESLSPYCVATYQLGPESKFTGQSMFRRAINRYKDYLENGPVGYSQGVQEIEIPAWAINAEDDETVGGYNMSLEKVNKLMGFIDGTYLDSSTLPTEGVEVTIKSITTESILNPRTFKESDSKVMYFEELKWGLVLGAKCNRKKLVGMVKENSSELIGKKIVIYNDPTVKFGRDTVGQLE